MIKAVFVIVLFSFLSVIYASPALAQKPGYRYEYENHYDEEGNIISTTRKQVKVEQRGTDDIIESGGTITVTGSESEFILVDRVYHNQPQARPHQSNYRIQTTNHNTSLYSLSGDYSKALSKLDEYSRYDFAASYSYNNHHFLDQDHFTFSDGSIPAYIIDGDNHPSFIRSLWLNLF